MFRPRPSPGASLAAAKARGLSTRESIKASMMSRCADLVRANRSEILTRIRGSSCGSNASNGDGQDGNDDDDDDDSCFNENALVLGLGLGLTGNGNTADVHAGSCGGSAPAGRLSARRAAASMASAFHGIIQSALSTSSSNSGAAATIASFPMTPNAARTAPQQGFSTPFGSNANSNAAAIASTNASFGSIFGPSASAGSSSGSSPITTTPSSSSSLSSSSSSSFPGFGLPAVLSRVPTAAVTSLGGTTCSPAMGDDDDSSRHNAAVTRSSSGGNSKEWFLQWYRRNAVAAISRTASAQASARASPDRQTQAQAQSGHNTGSMCDDGSSLILTGLAAAAAAAPDSTGSVLTSEDMVDIMLAMKDALLAESLREELAEVQSAVAAAIDGDGDGYSRGGAAAAYGGVGQACRDED